MIGIARLLAMEPVSSTMVSEGLIVSLVTPMIGASLRLYNALEDFIFTHSLIGLSAQRNCVLLQRSSESCAINPWDCART